MVPEAGDVYGPVPDRGARHTQESLARYMLPDKYMHLDEMPHTPSMKVDRNTLKQMMK